MSDLDKTIEKMERSDAWEDTDKIIFVEVKKRLDKVIPIRLSVDKWELIRAEAQELGVGPSTLARMWILERLRQPAEVRENRALYSGKANAVSPSHPKTGKAIRLGPKKSSLTK